MRTRKPLSSLLLLNLFGLVVNIFLGMFSPYAVASPQELTSIQRDSPFEVYQSFLSATQRLEADYSEYVKKKTAQQVQTLIRDSRRIRSLLDISQVPPATKNRVGNSAIAYLYDILARLPAIDVRSIPGYSVGGKSIDPTSLPERWTLPDTDLQIVRIKEGPHTGEYQFSANSVAQLEEYYHNLIDHPALNRRIYPSFYTELSEATGPWISERWVQRIPDWLRVHYFKTPNWKIALISLLILSAAALALSWTRFAWHHIRQHKHKKLIHLAWSLSVPLWLWLLVYAVDYLVTKHINPVGSFAISEGLLFSAIYYSIYAWLAWLMVYFIAEIVIRYAQQSDRNYDEPLIRLLAKLMALIAVTTILVKGTDELGIPALGLIAGLGVGGIAVALASQSTIENLFGGLSLFVDRPFRVQETILFNNQPAKVLHIGPRSTRLRALDGALWTVPNADLAKMHIANYTLRNSCYMDQTISLAANSSAAKIEELLKRLRKRLEEDSLVEVVPGWPRAKLVSFEPGRINIRLQATFLTTEQSVFLEQQQKIFLYVLATLHELRLELAHPVANLSSS